MATISDVLAANAFNLPMRVIDVADTSRTPGLTEELFTNNVLDSLGNGYPAFTSLFKKSKNQTIPTLENLFKVIGLSDDPEKVDGKDNRNRKTALEKFIENFPKDRGLYKEAMLEDERFGEKGYNTLKDLWIKAVNDKMTEDMAKGRRGAVNDGSVSGFIARTMFPRTTENIANNGDYNAKDVLLDFGENVAMSVPGPSWLAAPARVISALARRGGRVLPSAVTGAGRFLRNLGGNAVVPTSMEFVDDLAYDEGEGMDQRANFSIGDAAIGTAVNQVVNRGLMKLLSPKINEVTGSIQTRSPAIMKMREFLGSLGEGSSKFGDDFATAQRAIADAPIRSEEQIARQELDKAVAGIAKPSEVISKEAREKAVDNVKKLDAIDKGEFSMEEVRKLDLNNADERAIANYAAWHGPNAFATKSQKFSNILKQAIPSNVVNKIGREEMTRGFFPANVKEIIDEERTENRAEPKRKQVRSEVKEILDISPGLSEESIEFLNDIKKNPDIVKTGHPTKRDRFNLWLLTEGQDILRGTSAHRPIWDVK
jgi:hypothetical protein